MYGSHTLGMRYDIGKQCLPAFFITKIGVLVFSELKWDLIHPACINILIIVYLMQEVRDDFMSIKINV